MKRFVILAVLVLMVMAFVGCGKIKMDQGADGYVGCDHEDVVADLTELGFSDIEEVEIDDLTSASDTPDGAVSELSIDGNNSFKRKAKFKKDVPVIVTYHSIPKIEAPLTLEQISSMDYNDVAQAFSDAGFTNVKAKEIYDIDPEDTTESYNELLINDIGMSEDYQTIPFDAKIIAGRHVTYEEFQVDFKVDFTPNLIFSKYNVRVLMDGVEIAALDHGMDYEDSFTLRQGDHVITVEKEGDPDINGTAEFDVKSYTQLKIGISCSSDRVNVEIKSLMRATGSDTEDATEDTEEPAETETETEIETEVPETEKDTKDSQKTDAKAEYDDMSERVTGKYCSFVKQQMKDLGYTASYVHESTNVDITGDIEGNSDSDLDKYGFMVTGIKKMDSDKKTITLYVNTEDNIKSKQTKVSNQSTLEDNFDSASALTALEQYGKKMYPAGFEIHKITGMITEDAVDENTWFMKYKCKVTNAYGTKQEMTCEGKIEGPESSPRVYDFNVY